MDKKKILLVDDNPHIPRILQYYFLKKEKNWSCIYVSNGDKALEKLKEEKFELVILDIKLPLLKYGLETFHQIRKNYSKVLILILSVVADEPPTRDLDADAHMLKPFELKKLHTKIKELLK